MLKNNCFLTTNSKVNVINAIALRFESIRWLILTSKIRENTCVYIYTSYYSTYLNTYSINILYARINYL